MEMPRPSPFTQTPIPQPNASANSLNPSNFTGIITVLQQLVIGQSALTTAINNKFPNWVAVPPLFNSPGVAGQVAYEPGFFYICVASDHWQRVAIANF